MDYVYINNIIKDINKQTDFLPTRKNIYVLPNKLVKEFKSHYSVESIQKIADSIISYLGLTQKIGVKFGSDFSEYGIYDDKYAGIYCTTGKYHKEIQINKHSFYNQYNIYSILAHEMAHLYFDEKKIINQYFNKEIYTDILAVYLGFGSILLKGYTPIVTDVKKEIELYPYSLYNVKSHKIGYIGINDILQAMAIITKYRKIDFMQHCYGMPLVNIIKYVFYRSTIKRGDQ